MNIEYRNDVSAVQSIAALPMILDVVCRTTGMGFAAIARVTEDRWIACGVLDRIDFGLEPGGELQVETTICQEVRQKREAVVIDHVAEDVVYCGHPTPRMYGFQSYISMPIVLPDETFFGTLCAIDPRPARASAPEVVGMFQLFAELIAHHLNAGVRLADSEAQLLGERETARLREEFIAVLGHDLRSPLASIGAGTRMLARGPLDEKSGDIVQHMQGSVARMEGLIDNVLDLARGRLGGGISVDREARDIRPTLQQVLTEAETAWPDHRFEVDFDNLDCAVDCDHGRIAQLLSNLVGNAVTHGADDAPVRIEASTADGVFEISVANAGEPIPEAVREHLFKPFSRGRIRPGMRGLGLGLYIASEIAAAHGGVLSVWSDEGETRFSFRMPIGRD